jgi:arylsulfatase
MQTGSAGNCSGTEPSGKAAGKLLYLLKGAGGTGDWQLFNLKDDLAEMHDLSQQHPERRAAMVKLWDEYLRANGVIVSDAGPFATREP